MWDFALVKQDAYLVTGTNDSELRVWKMTFKDEPEKSGEGQPPSLKKLRVTSSDQGEESDQEDSGNEDDFDAGVLKVPF